ncbi:hypothetical protein FAIPA1_360010 [Frankia sp. AiPs1]|uniref:hypothetical protein n=1 Tax=Frankia sp. AiPa1 TaxID=573492 RepID=UPI00202AF2D4|nr:hypothetical protein [Frankia sp. AiPa1]MCL9759505.1 hypothetical protein [Frankia sp. AiPa1]
MNLPRSVVAMVFLCRLVDDAIASSTEESAEICWLSPDEVEKRFVPAFAVRVADALDGRSEAAVRAHDGVSVLNLGASG